MNIVEYMEAARRFDNHHEGPGMIDALVHGAVNEAIELWEEFHVEDEFLSWTAIRAEIGDVAWNLARLTGELGIEPTEVTCRWDSGTVIASHPVVAAHAAATVLRSVRKLSAFMEKAHRKNGPPLAEMVPLVVSTWLDLQRVAWRCGWSIYKVMESNIDKLTERYAERGLQLREA